MEVRHELARDGDRPLVLAIGFFDGFHRGHREIARQTLRLRKPGWRSGVLTFANHPAAHLRPGTEPAAALHAAGASRAVRSCRLRGMLLRDVRRRDCNALAGSVSAKFWSSVSACAASSSAATFRFGHKRAGDVDLMTEFLEERSVTIVSVEPVSDGRRSHLEHADSSADPRGRSRASRSVVGRHRLRDSRFGRGRGGTRSRARLPNR